MVELREETVCVGLPVWIANTGLEQCLRGLGDTPTILLENGPSTSGNIVRKVSPNLIHIIREEKNIYVNPAWNKIAEFFYNNTGYDWLVLLNSDLVLPKGWWEAYVDLAGIGSGREHLLCVPDLCDSLSFVRRADTTTREYDRSSRTDSYPGVFLPIRRQEIPLLFPIPDSFKLWFGDTYLFHRMRKEKTILHGISAYHFHNGSQSISHLAERDAILERDKEAWAEFLRTESRDE